MNLIHEAIERGVSLFDTAESYGYHKNELLVGEALKGYSDRVFVSSKFGHKFVNGVQVKTEEDSSPANIRRVCATSAWKRSAYSTSTAQTQTRRLKLSLRRLAI